MTTVMAGRKDLELLTKGNWGMTLEGQPTIDHSGFAFLSIALNEALFL